MGQQRKLKACFFSLGCVKNLVDSECILGMLKEKKIVITDEIKGCNLIFINTCGFITSAKRESINTIFDVILQKRLYAKKAKIIVVGCLAKRYKKQLTKAIPEIDLIVGVDEYDKIGSYINRLLKIRAKGEFDMLKRSLTSQLPVAYLKIGEGCSNRCAYCAIPLIRGDFYSYKKEDIIADAKRLISLGKREIIVIAQDPTRYGKDIYDNYFLEELMEDLLALDRNVFFRVLYLYPDRVSSKLIDVFINNKNLMPYFDIPIQHSSNKMLELMSRSGTREKYIKVINEIINNVPNAVLRTTVITGFPGETDEDFEDLKSFIQRIKFDHLGAFTFSREEKTPAYKFKDRVYRRIANARRKELMAIQQKISRQLNENRIGEIHYTLIESFDGEFYYGRSYLYAPDAEDGNIIIVSDKELILGEFYNVKIIGALDYDVIGEVVKEKEK